MIIKGNHRACIGLILTMIPMSEGIGQAVALPRRTLPTPAVRRVAASYSETATCSGFDASTTPPWLMSPLAGSNQANAAVNPAGAFADVRFVSNNTGVATVTPTTLPMTPGVLSVAGVAKGTTRIVSKTATTASIRSLGSMNSTVKERLNKTVAIHSITEENDDVQTNLQDSGAANPACISPGVDGVLNSTRAGDDTIVAATTINAGADGRCDSTAAGDDVQLIPVARGRPCVGEGPNGFRDTATAAGDDEIIGNDIDSGPNGVCDTAANRTNLLPTNVPTAAALQTYVNLVYGQQMNVFFTVSRVDRTVNYDLNRNGGVPDPPSGSLTSTEMDAISVAAKSSTDLNVYFVNVMDAPNATTLPTLRESWIQDAHGAETAENIAVHEMAHSLRLDDKSDADSINDLMYFRTNAANPNPCILRKFEWDISNP